MDIPINDDRLANERGAVAVEYGLMLGLVTLVIISAVTAFGVSLGDLYDRSCDDVSSAIASTTC